MLHRYATAVIIQQQPLTNTLSIYYDVQKVLALRRRKQAKKQGSAAVLFAALDKDGSGEISLHEFQASLETLSLGMSERSAAGVLASIDVDHSGTIDQLEFEAWMQHSAGKMERIKTALLQQPLELLFAEACHLGLLTEADVARERSKATEVQLVAKWSPRVEAAKAQQSQVVTVN